MDLGSTVYVILLLIVIVIFILYGLYYHRVSDSTAGQTVNQGLPGLPYNRFGNFKYIGPMVPPSAGPAGDLERYQYKLYNLPGSIVNNKYKVNTPDLDSVEMDSMEYSELPASGCYFSDQLVAVRTNRICSPSDPTQGCYPNFTAGQIVEQYELNSKYPLCQGNNTVGLIVLGSVPPNEPGSVCLQGTSIGYTTAGCNIADLGQQWIKSGGDTGDNPSGLLVSLQNRKFGRYLSSDSRNLILTDSDGTTSVNWFESPNFQYPVGTSGPGGQGQETNTVPQQIVYVDKNIVNLDALMSGTPDGIRKFFTSNHGLDSIQEDPTQSSDVFGPFWLPKDSTTDTVPYSARYVQTDLYNLLDVINF